MDSYTGTLLGRVRLRFSEKGALAPSDLSAAARLRDGSLVVAGDERARLELLSNEGHPHVYEQQRSEDLCAALGLDEDGEVDIEGLTTDDDCATLYLVGSHSAKRKKPRGKDVESDLERLATVKVDPARFVLAQLALKANGTLPSAEQVEALPREGEGSLLDLLSDDPHLAAYLPAQGQTIPGKDNGFDIEGLALQRGRVLLGLRGPVLRGHAFVLDFSLEKGASFSLRNYRKHVLDLDGLGVRDLLVHGDDLLVLAGPTMALDGAHRLYRWCGGPSKHHDSIIRQEKGVLEPLFELPTVRGYDRAEGITHASWFEDDDSLLVLYDSPGQARRVDAHGVLADVFAL